MPPTLPKLSVYVLCGSAALSSHVYAESAVSPEAAIVRDDAADVVDRLENSQALFSKKAEAMNALEELTDECSADGWDGDGTVALNSGAVSLTKDFVRALPDQVPMPEFAAEPDGSVSMDWMQARNRMFSISVGPTQRLAFAWLDGTDKGHGVAHFDGTCVPPLIMDLILGIVNDGLATVRTA